MAYKYISNKNIYIETTQLICLCRFKVEQNKSLTLSDTPLLVKNHGRS